MILDDGKVLSEKVIEHRNRVRAVYSTEEGKQELFNLIYDCGLLGLLTPDNLATRNYAVKKLMELGILDESVIRGLISKWLDSNPEADERARMKREEEKKEADTFGREYGAREVF